MLTLSIFSPDRSPISSPGPFSTFLLPFSFLALDCCSHPPELTLSRLSTYPRHGISRTFHHAPYILHTLASATEGKNKHLKMEVGDCFTIEPSVEQVSESAGMGEMWADGWTVVTKVSLADVCPSRPDASSGNVMWYPTLPQPFLAGPPVWVEECPIRAPAPHHTGWSLCSHSLDIPRHTHIYKYTYTAVGPIYSTLPSRSTSGVFRV